MTSQPPQLSIIIVSWNVRELLRRCLNSIQHHLNRELYEVIVVDNASSDGSADMVANEFPQIDLIRNTKNIGFGRANNLGLAKAQGEFVLFLNDDTELQDSNVMQTLEYMRNHPKVGLLGAHLVNPDGSNQPSVRRFPQLSDQLMYVLKLHVLFPRAKAIQRYLAQNFDYTAEAKVDQIMGAMMLARTKVMKDLAGFDPGYPNWFEEVDLCRRVYQLGLEVWYVPITQIIHVKGASFAQHRPFKLQRVFNYSMRRYFKKWEPWWAYSLITVAQPISLIAAALVQFTGVLGLNLKGMKAKHI